MCDRSAIEKVICWCDPRLALLVLAQVGREWTQATLSDALWSTYFSLFSIQSVENPSKNAFQKAVSETKRSILVGLKEEIAFFDCEKRTVEKRTELRVNASMAAVVLYDRKALFCGGDRNEKGAFEVGRDGSVGERSEMTQKRTFHAAILLASRVYVFGGMHARSAKAAECYSLLRKRWTALPSMLTARSCFSVARQKHVVFLCGGNAVECESFNTNTEVYTQLPYRLPEATWTACCVHEQSLLIVQGSEFYYPQRTGLTAKTGLVSLSP